MYCPSCGAEYAQKLNYCKRCGATLTLPASNTEPAPMRPPKFGWMFWAIAALGLGGLGISAGIVGTMASFGIHGEDLILTLVVSLIFIFGIAGLLVWQLSRIITAYQQTTRALSVGRPALPESLPAQIAPPPETASSVVEHTTRQFAHPTYKEPVPRE